MTALRAVPPTELKPTPVSRKPRTPRAKAAAKPVAAITPQMIRAVMAAVGAGFLPLASYLIAHLETATSPAKWVLVGAALVYSSPTLADWAESWCGNVWKAWGFTVLLEGVMLFSSTPWLAPAGLAILVGINCAAAYQTAVKVRKV